MEKKYRDHETFHPNHCHGQVYWWPKEEELEEILTRRKILPKIDVVIPALNEESSIELVVKEIPDLVRQVIVVDNGSVDQTASIAREAGAIVIQENRRGYGYACLKGIAFLKKDPPDIIVFLDADYSDFPKQLLRLVLPIMEGDAEMVIGSRSLGGRSTRALMFHQRFGNDLACFLIDLFWKYQFTDLGPFRALRWESLQLLEMKDVNYGWTVEMQIKAARKRCSVVEVPVDYRPRIGKSKISGTVKGSFKAGTKILSLIAKEAIKDVCNRL